VEHFNQTGWIAVFTGTDTEPRLVRDVERWDESGVALVVDPARGTLRRVTHWSSFSHLERVKKVVSVLPGGGWSAHWNGERDGGTSLAEPVLAWLISSDGKATPVTVDGSGLVSPATSADRITAPGEQRGD
jgi:hypothetical protein